jgi:hypothetical protein
MNYERRRNKAKHRAEKVRKKYLRWQRNRMIKYHMSNILSYFKWREIKKDITDIYSFTKIEIKNQINKRRY